MNGYKILASHYRKKSVESPEFLRKAELMDFLSSTNKDDLCSLFDSGAFNDIAKAMLEIALDSMEISTACKQSIYDQYANILSSTKASEALEKWTTS